MKTQLINQDKSESKNLSLNEAIFGSSVNEALVHEVVTSYMSNSRLATRGHKNRSAASGGGAKPWRQKGTGRARAGTNRSPIWVGGGKTHTANNRSYTKKINKKVLQKAIKSIFSSLAKDERIIFLDTLVLQEPKTKEMIDILNKLEVTNALIILKEYERNIDLASRNIPHIEVITTSQINPVSLLNHDCVIINSDALKEIENTYK
jgi:large subunit ribosomal protein L4